MASFFINRPIGAMVIAILTVLGGLIALRVLPLAQFPEIVRASCPVAGAARTAEFNSVFLLSLRRALELDPAFQDGFYDRPPVAGSSQVQDASIDGMNRH